MSKAEYALLQDVIMDADFPDLDLALRRGRHIDRDDAAWYSLLTDAQELLEPFYRRYGCELIHKTDGYFYLLPTGEKVSRKQLAATDMLVGQALALLYLDPAAVERGGVVSQEEVVSQLSAVLGSDALIGVFSPGKRKAKDERIAQRNVRQRVGEAVRRLAVLGFVEVSDESAVRLRAALLRFAEPVRGLSEPAEALAKLVAQGEVALAPDEPEDGAEDSDEIGDAEPERTTLVGVPAPSEGRGAFVSSGLSAANIALGVPASPDATAADTVAADGGKGAVTASPAATATDVVHANTADGSSSEVGASADPVPVSAASAGAAAVVDATHDVAATGLAAPVGVAADGGGAVVDAALDVTATGRVLDDGQVGRADADREDYVGDGGGAVVGSDHDVALDADDVRVERDDGGAGTRGSDDARATRREVNRLDETLAGIGAPGADADADETYDTDDEDALELVPEDELDEGAADGDDAPLPERSAVVRKPRQAPVDRDDLDWADILVPEPDAEDGT